MSLRFMVAVSLLALACAYVLPEADHCHDAGAPHGECAATCAGSCSVCHQPALPSTLATAPHLTPRDTDFVLARAADTGSPSDSAPFQPPRT